MGGARSQQQGMRSLQLSPSRKKARAILLYHPPADLAAQAVALSPLPSPVSRGSRQGRSAAEGGGGCTRYICTDEDMLAVLIPY